MTLKKARSAEKRPPLSNARVAAPSGDAQAVDLTAWADRVLAALPKAKVAWKAQRPSFTIGGKIFAFTGSRGATVLKLPVARVRELIDAGEVTVLTMGKRKMREWVVCSQVSTERELDLACEASAFVASLAGFKGMPPC